LTILLFAEPAEADLDSIVDYIAVDDPNTAETVFRAIVAAAEQLTNFPEMGRPGRMPGTREFLVRSLPYLIVYEVNADTVTILAVFHSARDLPRALAERKSKLPP
jgi:toxin ParE1/3/4